MISQNLTPLKQSGKKGFTLTEILVVIAIILVLAALGTLGLSKAQAKGYQTVAMSNLRQLQIANQQYAVENNGGYVPAWSFDDDGLQSPPKWNVNDTFLEFFRGEVPHDAPNSVKYTMPENVLDPIALRAGHSYSKRLQKSYGMNITTLPGGRNNTPGSKRKVSMGQIKDPSRTCAFMTGQNAFLTHSGRFAYNGTEENSGNTTTAYRHDGKALCVFFDGHTETRTKEDMREMDKNGGSKHPFWKGF